MIVSIENQNRVRTADLQPTTALPAFHKAGPHSALFSAQEVNGTVVVARLSEDLNDSGWDDFLQKAALGHFQQSSLWARAKSIEGWRPIRMVLTMSGQIVGGFQILFRKTRLGHVGYVSKGPVFLREEPALIDFALALLTRIAKEKHLRAVIVQAPDESKIDGAMQARHRFLANHLVQVISATLVTDLSCGMDAVEKEIAKSTLARVRRARKRGITIRPGGEQDVGTFFRLMLATCERQKTKPAPASESALLELWKTFHAADGVRLTFAEYEGEPVAGALCLCFGDRVTFWKVGWTGQHPERHPNRLLTFENIKWSVENGYKWFDQAGVDQDIARTLSLGKPLSESQQASRDVFKLGFGGRPLLLPADRVLIVNPVARFAYRTLMPLKNKLHLTLGKARQIVARKKFSQSRM